MTQSGSGAWRLTLARGLFQCIEEARRPVDPIVLAHSAAY
jgi:hypothetical protein